jgi:hypothetical protein
MQHRIKKQVLQLLVDPGLDAFAIQQAASNCYWEEILPVLERVFDELSSEGEYLRVDRLELDLGKITAADLRGGGMRAGLYTLLKRQLEEGLKGRPSAEAPLPSRESGPEHALRQWMYYMQHGRLHWSQPSLSGDSYNAVLEMLSADYAAVSHLREAMLREARLLSRIAAQHPDTFLETLTGILVAEKQTGLIEVIGDILHMSRLLEADVRRGPMPIEKDLSGDEGATSIHHANLLAWMERNSEFLRLPEPRRKEAVWRMVLREAAVQPAAFRAGGASTLLWDGLSGTDRLLASRWQRLAPAPRRTTPPPAPEGTTIPDKAPQPATGEPAAKPAIPMGVDTPEDIRFDQAEVDEEGMYVSHAGVILLHPFLPTCFSRLHWWEEGRFVDSLAWQKAVFLLHYLATGETDATGEKAAMGGTAVSEYQLVLPKILCGYSPGMPLPATGGLTEEECAEGDELLQMVLIRWEKLQSTSITGLREGFLQRPGKLFRRNDRLTLLVEGHAIDVLLDFLPWGLGIVKLPWMNEILYVEWR